MESSGCVARGRNPTGPITQLGEILGCYRVPMPRCHMHERLRVKDVVARATHVRNAFSEAEPVRSETKCRLTWANENVERQTLRKYDDFEPLVNNDIESCYLFISKNDRKMHEDFYKNIINYIFSFAV